VDDEHVHRVQTPQITHPVHRQQVARVALDDHHHELDRSVGVGTL
jgi:hypothetical protein